MSGRAMTKQRRAEIKQLLTEVIGVMWMRLPTACVFANQVPEWIARELVDNPRVRGLMAAKKARRP